MNSISSLFSDKYLHAQFKQLDLPETAILNEKLACISRWKKSLINQSILQSKEESLQGDFLQQFFVTVLEYSNQKDSGAWSLETEQKTLDNKKMDGALGFFKIENHALMADVRVVIELKNAKTDLDKPQARKDDKRTPVQQAFDYANTLGGSCRWIIVSNFKEIRLYKQGDRTTYQAFDILTLDNIEKFKPFYLLLTKKRLIAQTGDSLTDKLFLNQQEEKLAITKRFYADYKQARFDVFHRLKADFPPKDPLLLLAKTQKLVDRLIFIRFCESNAILAADTLKELIECARKDKFSRDKNKIFKRLHVFFAAIDKGDEALAINQFNGGLFKEDAEFDDLMTEDALLEPVLKLVEYDFKSDLDVNILGHIFEQSLSDIEELKAEISGAVLDKKQGKRKKDGIYYTPDYITQYIVEEAIGGWLKERRAELNEAALPELNEADLFSIAYITKGKDKGAIKWNAAIQTHIDFYQAYQKILSNIKVLDPACGSGAFLNQAFDFLHAENVRVNQRLAELMYPAEQSQLNLLKLNEKLAQHILNDNLFGVDLNEESVEITRLSLWIKTANRRDVLTTLDENIKCGNSLIDDINVAGEKAFVWEKEFNAIMEKGGFDVVIGNPPYGAKIDKESQKFLLEAYNINSTDTAVVFIKKSSSLIKNNGILGFIIPKAFSFSSSYATIRNHVWDNLTHLVDCGKVWKEVLLEQVIVIINTARSHDTYASLKRNNEKIILLDYINKLDATKFGFFLNSVSNQEISVAEKINVSGNYLNDISENHRGAMLQSLITDKGMLEAIGGNDIDRFGIRSIKGKLSNNNDTKAVIKKNSVLVQNIVAHIENPVDHIKITACIPIAENYLIIDTINQIVISKDYSQYYVWCLLNSKLINWYLYRFVYAKAIRTMHFDNTVTMKLPFIKASEKEQQPFIEKANIMLAENKNLQNQITAFLDFISAEFKPQKISNKLHHYYELDWLEFKAELKKGKVDLDKFDLKKRREWQAEFEREKQKALGIKNSIDQTDNAIDSMVYALYGLNETDIAIINQGGQ